VGQTISASRSHDGAINRIVTPTVPIQVTYELTALGTELTLRLRNLITWIDDHTSTILEAHAAAPALALNANVEDARLNRCRISHQPQLCLRGSRLSFGRTTRCGTWRTDPRCALIDQGGTTRPR